MIQLKHIALSSRSEEKCDRFYGHLLGLEKLSSKVLPQNLAKQIFGLDAEIKIINYVNDQLYFEIFIREAPDFETDKAAHVCLLVDDLKNFLAQCRDLDIKIQEIPRGDSLITFIKDYDGNQFEIKESS
jgi:catechol 2,3-dioxygenase-like lactoylglutathione lyase family enzyme